MPKNPYKQINNLSKFQKNRRLRVLLQASAVSDTCTVARPINVDIVISNTVASNPDNEINHANAELFDKFNIYCTTSCSNSSNDYFENEYFNECSKNSNLFTKLKEWARKPRALFELCHWKGAEFKLLILYIGPLVLKNMLSPNLYAHFMTLQTLLLCCTDDSDNDMFEPA